jgi:hypothetical protein
MQTRKRGVPADKPHMLTTATVQDYKHRSTEEIRRHREVLVCELKVLERELLELASRSQVVRTSIKALEARIAGLGQVVAARQ